VFTDIGRFEFVKLSALRAAQLMRGCTPRVNGCRKLTTTAQREVAEGKVSGLPRAAAVASIVTAP
jgi:DNA-directed RNA polymerase subunit K/omega